MKEEEVTRSIIKTLIDNNWAIKSYSFPQSGNSVIIHVDRSSIDTNGGVDKGIIPDIIAIKDKVALFFENKGYFYFPDFLKVHEMKTSDKYENSIKRIIGQNIIAYFGIGVPNTLKIRRKSLEQMGLVDFVMFVDNNQDSKLYCENENLRNAVGNFSFPTIDQ